LSPILKIILSRLGMGILTLLIVSVLIFSAIELLPGDIATETLGNRPPRKPSPHSRSVST